MIAKTPGITFAFYMMLLVSACTQAGDENAREAEGAAGPAESVTVEMFAPGDVNSTWPEYGITFSVTGDTVFYNRSNPNLSNVAIMRSIRNGDEWLKPEVASFSGEFFDIIPFLNPDGSVFYSSLRMNPETNQESFDNMLFLSPGTTVKLPGGLNSDSTDAFVSATMDGSLVFESNRTGSNRIWISKLEDGLRQPPSILQIPGVQEPGNPFISDDGRTLLFVDTSGADSDLAYSCLVGTDWTLSARFPPAINSSYDDFAPSTDREGYIFFATQRPGMAEHTGDTQLPPPSDIYRADLKIQNLCPSVNP